MTTTHQIECGWREFRVNRFCVRGGAEQGGEKQERFCQTNPFYKFCKALELSVLSAFFGDLALQTRAYKTRNLAGFGTSLACFLSFFRDIERCDVPVGLDASQTGVLAELFCLARAVEKSEHRITRTTRGSAPPPLLLSLRNLFPLARTGGTHWPTLLPSLRDWKSPLCKRGARGGLAFPFCHFEDNLTLGKVQLAE